MSSEFSGQISTIRLLVSEKSFIPIEVFLRVQYVLMLAEEQGEVISSAFLSKPCSFSASLRLNRHNLCLHLQRCSLAEAQLV